MAYPFRMVNQRGSAAIGSSAVAVNADNVVFSFPNHAFVGAYYFGTVFIKLQQAIPSGTADTLPVLFETNGVTQAITKYGGAAVTVGDLQGIGVYQFWYEKPNDVLQLMTV